MKNKNVAAIILAGGQNKRMQGRDKGKIAVNGRPIIERTIAVLKGIFEEVFVVTNKLKRYNYPGVTIVEDKIKNLGPLGGIYTGLEQIDTEAGFFVACDMPFLHNGVIRRELNYLPLTPSTSLWAGLPSPTRGEVKEYEAIVPRIGSFIEPLHGIYKTVLKDRIFNFIQSGDSSIKNFLQTINVYYWDLEDNDFNRRVFSNWNTPEDLGKCRAGLL